MSDVDVKVKVIPNGPLRVSGAGLCRIGIERNEHARPTQYNEHGEQDHAEAYSLCRCGASANKPFCDGAHKNIEWDPAETADRRPTAERQTTYAGDGFAITDDKSLCWHAGFCVREYGHVWDLTAAASTDGDKQQIQAMVQSCPTSRLQYQEPAGSDPIEPELDQRIAVIDDGPLYLQGGIPVESADGESYETLNRVSLCRCGASANKPYCDGAHTKIDFEDSE
jgi:CDGSH-type Zn-finger protein